MPTYELKLQRIKKSDENPAPITSALEVIDYLKRHKCYTAEGFWREECWMIGVNRKKVPVGHFHVSMGGEHACYISIQLVARVALMSGADAVIITHNHPDGNSLPNIMDIEQTQKLKNALKTVGIELVDHIIIAPDKHYSFSEEKVTKTENLF